MKRKKDRKRTPAFSGPAVFVYFGMLVLFLLAGVRPHHNLWSVDWWGYFPVSVPFGLFLLGLLLLFGISRWNLLSADHDISRKSYRATSGATVVFFAFLFWSLRAQTHYLGDGYQLLSRLASNNPIIKPWNFGGISLPYGLSRILGGGSEGNVLLSYQVISISSGLILAFVTWWAARRLFSTNIDRLLFLLGVMTAGTSLLFFGYVENYSLFVVSVYTFGLVGLLVAQGKASRYWLLPLIALAVFFHIFGLILLPATIYLLGAGSRIGDWVVARSRSVKLIGSAVAPIVLAAVFWYLYTNYYFFRFSFVPLIQDRFTVDGYTLFSGQHLLDWLSLLILLVPGLFVAITALLKGWPRALLQRREFRFLATMLVCCLGAVFVLDPKLGMPRDWDLFSFVGVPLILLVFYSLLSGGAAGRQSRRVSVLIIALGALVLIPRAWSEADYDVSIAHLKNYSDHDTAKSVPIMTVWINQLASSGQMVLAQQESAKGRSESPELAIADQGWELLNQARFRAAIEKFRRVVVINPMRSKSWAGIGNCFAQLKQPDSAMEYLGISDGLNPYNPYVYSNMGFAQFLLGNYDKAEAYWLEARRLDTAFVDPMIGLFNLYTLQGHEKQRIELLLKLAVNGAAPPAFISGQIGELMERGFQREAQYAFALLAKRAPGSQEVHNLLVKYPALSRPDITPTKRKPAKP